MKIFSIFCPLKKHSDLLNEKLPFSRPDYSEGPHYTFYLCVGICNEIEHNLCRQLYVRWMDGWMTCDFTSFSTVFRSYQDDERLIMKGCVQWNSVYS